MSEQMKKDVKAQVEAQHTKAQELHSGTANPVAKPGIEANRGYVRVSQGYPVQPGQTWHDLTPAQRKDWFNNHENKWKKRYGIQAGQAIGAPANMDWTRG